MNTGDDTETVEELRMSNKATVVTIVFVCTEDHTILLYVIVNLLTVFGHLTIRGLVTTYDNI